MPITAKVKYVASDKSEWDSEAAALARENLVQAVETILGALPKPPRRSNERVSVPPEVHRHAKIATVELCRGQFPNEAIFKHDPMEIHPFSYAGRFLDDCSPPLYRLWNWFMCYRDGWLYEQPYFALNPDKWEAEQAR